MEITKIGHCCLLIKTNGLTILTDPGEYSTHQNSLTGINLVLITHEHPDHLHLDSLKKVLGNNPQAKVLTNSGVGGILKPENISFELLEDGQNARLGGVEIAAHGSKHAFIYDTVKDVVNTGFFIDGRLFYPGDNFYNPQKPVEILALPVSAPWLKIAESLNYLKEINPRVCFPVHDGNVKSFGVYHRLPKAAAELLKTKFVDFEQDNSPEF